MLNKLRAVLTRPFAADLLGSATSTFRMSDILDGGILLARLPKGLLGEDTTRLVGSLLLAGLWQAATGRAAQPEHRRLDAAVYVDECQNFLHLPGALDDVLAEARGYHLSLTLAHQHLGQLSRELADAIHASPQQSVLTVSPNDARQLARHVGPILTDSDLSRLDRYQAACRLVVDGRDTPGFTLATHTAPAPTGHIGELLAAAANRGRTAAQRHQARLQRRPVRSGEPIPGEHTADGWDDAFPDRLTDDLADGLDPSPDPSPADPVNAHVARLMRRRDEESDCLWQE